MTDTSRRLEKLHSVEQEISSVLNIVTDAVLELSKDSCSTELVEYKTKDLIKTLEGIERSLQEEILYLTKVSTTQAHEGSVYGAEKDYQLIFLQGALAKQKLQHFQSLSSPSPSSSSSSSSTQQPLLSSTGIPSVGGGGGGGGGGGSGVVAVGRASGATGSAGNSSGSTACATISASSSSSQPSASAHENMDLS